MWLPKCQNDATHSSSWPAYLDPTLHSISSSCCIAAARQAAAGLPGSGASTATRKLLLLHTEHQSEQHWPLKTQHIYRGGLAIFDCTAGMPRHARLLALQCWSTKRPCQPSATAEVHGLDRQHCQHAYARPSRTGCCCCCTACRLGCVLPRNEGVGGSSRLDSCRKARRDTARC